MSEEKKKKKATKIIAGIVGAITLIGGTTGGIIATTDIEENEEEKKKNQTGSGKNGKIIKPVDNKQDLATLITTKNLGTIKTDGENKPNKEQIKRIIKNKNKKININKIEITDIEYASAKIIPSINVIDNDYIGNIIVNYIIDKYVDLSYIVSDLNNRNKKVSSFHIESHEEIKDAKVDILQDNRFKDLPKIEEFINDLNEIVKWKANKNIMDDFKRIENNTNHFKNFEDLNQQFNDHHLPIGGEINFSSFINEINKNIKKTNKKNIEKDINLLKEKLLRFYNILSQVYGKEMVFKMLKTIIIEDQSTKWNPGMGGKTHYGKCSTICASKIELNTKNFENIELGFENMVHEYGHVFEFYFRENKAFWEASEWLAYHMNVSIVRGTQINNPHYQTLMNYAIVRSAYGRQAGISDLFAEAFSRWIMTPEENRDLGWEKLDNFFRIDLPILLNPKYENTIKIAGYSDRLAGYYDDKAIIGIKKNDKKFYIKNNIRNSKPYMNFRDEKYFVITIFDHHGKEIYKKEATNNDRTSILTDLNDLYYREGYIIEFYFNPSSSKSSTIEYWDSQKHDWISMKKYFHHNTSLQFIIKNDNLVIKD